MTDPTSNQDSSADATAAQLKESQENLHALINSVHGVISLMKADGTVLAINEAAANYLGTTAKELIGKSVYKTVPKAMADDRREKVATVIKTRKPLTYTFSAHGSHFQNSLYPIVNKEGDVTRIAVFGLDISNMVESTKKQNALVSNLNQGVAYHRLVVDENNIPIDFIWLEANEKFEEFTGLTRKNIIGKPVTQVIPDIRIADPDLIQLYGEVVQTQKSRQFENYFAPLDRWYQIHVFPCGEDVFCTLFSDITAAKKYEAALKNSENRFRSIIESSPLGIHMYSLQENDQLVFEGANRSADQILKVQNQQFVGKTIEDAFPPLAQTEVPARYRKAAKEGEPWATEQITYDHREIAGAFDVRAFQTSPGKMVAMFQDITERKRSEVQLQHALERLRSLEATINRSPVMVFRWRMTENWAVEFASDNVAILGYTPEEFMSGSVPWSSITHPDDVLRLNEEVAHYLNSEITEFSLEYRLITKDGNILWVEDRNMALRDSTGAITHMEGLVFDVTARKEADTAIRRYSETQKILFREVNHRVKNNLAAIISMIHKERDRELESKISTQEVLQVLEERVSSLVTVHSLLSAGGWEPLQLSDLCDRIVRSTLQSIPSAKQATLHIKDTPIMVDSNQANHLSLVLNELTVNVTKHVLDKQDTVHIEIVIDTIDDNVRLSFKDNGEGFPANEQIQMGVGFDLINGLVQRSLRGTICTRSDGGAVVEMTFPLAFPKNKRGPQ